MLKTCPDCTKTYSIRATSCVHCGSPNDDLLQHTRLEETEPEKHQWIWIIILIIITFLMFFYGKETRSFVLNFLNVGVVAEVDLQHCDSERIKNEIRENFESSPYALRQHLKVVTMEVQQHQTSAGAKLSCLSTMVLNNNQKINYLMDFKKQGQHISVEGHLW